MVIYVIIKPYISEIETMSLWHCLKHRYGVNAVRAIACFNVFANCCRYNIYLLFVLSFKSSRFALLIQSDIVFCSMTHSQY